MKTSKSKKTILRVVAPVMVAAMALAPVFNTVSAFAIGRDGYKAILDYSTLDDAKTAAAKLDEEIGGEGAILLKNDGTLPIPTGARVTLFGSAVTSLKGGQSSVTPTVTLPQALANGGYDVNSLIVTESTAKNVNNADIQLYSQAAIVVLSRGGSEGSDLSVNSGEDAKETENIGGWTHEQLTLQSGKEKKHGQMLSDAEIALIAKAKETCKSVIVLLNTSNPMELYNLEQDARINAIMFLGRIGANSIKAVPNLL
ncbi:MAG: glycoside hydrolase family 3 C-terminal domain-containing protein, partial [Clostridia bacterium]|nr:glycoside hydrolase family 3 C-terminal domain-containing protein [Clostridia bacterium]